MGLIKSLPEKLVSKIAAGEVVERPASVVKELVENSVDAEASFIKIEIENAGLRKIQITDDGKGMSDEDIIECFKPHTTSKIFYEDDLFNIVTMGFRGEALSSISSVANVVIKSRQAQEISGNIIEIENGELIRHTSIGMPQGTTVLVRNLFGRLPARKKFLKSNKTEFRNILETVINFSLAHPEVGFFLSNDKRIILDLPSQSSVSERIRVLLGKDIYANLIPISYEEAYYKVSGFVVKPQISTSNRSKQFVFVNKRNVYDNLISTAVKDAYGSLLMPREQPAFVLFFETMPSLIDVNIHPRKEEVAFTDDNAVYELFKSAIEPAFVNEDLKYSFDDYIDNAVDYDFDDVVNSFLKDESEEFYDNEQILQIHNLYLVKQTKKGILIIDQHAAHERILYENIVKQIKEKSVDLVKDLSEPVLFDLSLSETEVLSEYSEILSGMGFDIESFGDNTFKISAVPFYVAAQNAEVLIKEVLEDLMQGKTPKSIDSKTDRALSFVACRSAIKAGDYLTPDEREKLFIELAKAKTIYTCPHGRPVKMELTMNELARMFKRK